MIYIAAESTTNKKSFGLDFQFAIKINIYTTGLFMCTIFLLSGI